MCDIKRSMNNFSRLQYLETLIAIKLKTQLTMKMLKGKFPLSLDGKSDTYYISINYLKKLPAFSIHILTHCLQSMNLIKLHENMIIKYMHKHIKPMTI